MALLRQFRKTTRDRYTVHAPVDCSVITFVANDRTYLQLDTHGSDSRKIPGKISQSIQIDEAGAKHLITLLRRTFSLD